MSSDSLVLRRINSELSPPNGNTMSAIDASSFNIFLKACVLMRGKVKGERINDQRTRVRTGLVR